MTHPYVQYSLPVMASYYRSNFIQEVCHDFPARDSSAIYSPFEIVGTAKVPVLNRSYCVSCPKPVFRTVWLYLPVVLAFVVCCHPSNSLGSDEALAHILRPIAGVFAERKSCDFLDCQNSQGLGGVHPFRAAIALPSLSVYCFLVEFLVRDRQIKTFHIRRPLGSFRTTGVF